MSEYTKINEEVFYGKGPIIKVDSSDLDMIARVALSSPRKRARICSHKDAQDPIHEMLIALAVGVYIRPHKHMRKSESFHMIKGSLKVIIFDEEGSVREVVELSDFSYGKNFYYRLNQDCFHTVLPLSDVVIFHETTNGPFSPDATVFAPWAPAEDDLGGVRSFEASLIQQLRYKK